MIKFILAIVAIVFIGLAYYAYMGKTDDNKSDIAVKTQEISTPKKTLKEEDIIPDRKQPIKNITKPKVSIASKKEVDVTSNLESTGEIGKDVSLESINSADVSDEEKQHMLDDMANYVRQHAKDEPNINLEEVFKIIEKDFEQGLIN